MMIRIIMICVAALLATSAVARTSRHLPRHVGECAVTRISEISARLEDGITHQPIPDSGSAVDFTNGGHQVSYDMVGAIIHSRVGDPVRMCLTLIPHPCPPGDVRGREYRTTNLRTHRSWTLQDSEHSCGGA